MSEKKEKKFKKLKCMTCHNYDNKIDYCYEKDIANCSKQIHKDFSTCEDYLVKESLVMF